MIKRLTAFLILSTMIITNITNITLAEEKAEPTKVESNLQVNARSAVIMDANSGKVIYEQNGNEKLAPASVTKIMTLLLIYDAVSQKKINWDDTVTISEHAASMGGSQIFLEPNEQQNVKTLTKSIAIASANDAAVAMAEYIGGSEEGFVQMMNEKAKEIGMKNTNFENACGLDTDNHLTTAYDIALMSREIMTKYPDIKEYTTTWQDTITHTTKKGTTEFGLTNTNKLIKWYNGATGLKTGSTGKALYCLSGTAEKNGMSLIAVVMAAPDPKIRFQEVMKMFDYGFGNFTNISGEPKDKVMGKIKIYKGKDEEVNAVVKDNISVLVKKGSDKNLQSNVNIVEGLKAPFEKGTKVGEIIYTYQNEEVGRSDIVTDKGVQKATLNDTFQKLLIKWFQ